jgi:small subunit ribosomal protein S18
MTRLTPQELKKRRKKKARLKKKLTCRFCPEGPKKSPRPVYIDYKDLKTLRTLIDRNARILPRRRTGTSAKWHRAVRLAVIRARFIALLPYIPEE